NTPGGGCANCTEPLAWESPLGYAVKGPSSGSWTYSNGGIAVKWLPAKNYTIAARGRDNAYPAQNISSSYTIANVVYDLSWPTATVTGPSNRTPARSVALTSGTVLDNFDGVASVALVISYVQAGATYYWTGSTFTAGAYQTVPAVVAAPGSVNTTWNYTDADLTDWTNNGISYREYVIHAIATDRAGNVHVAGTTSTFVLDNRAPTGTATRPTANALSSSGHNFYGPANLLGNILGNSNDQNSYPAGYPTAEASKVEARIKRDGAGSLVWNACQAGCTWTGAAIWQTVNDTSSWNYGLNRLPDFGQGQSLGWDSGRRMSVEVRVTDLVGNLSTLTTQYFTWDSALPTSSLSYPASAYMPAVAAVNGTAADLDTILAGLGKGSGVRDVEVAVRDNRPAFQTWWDGTGFNISDGDHSAGAGWIKASTAPEVAPPTGAVWSLPATTVTFVTSINGYSVNARALDYANNVTAPVSTFSFIFDGVKPAAVLQKPPVLANLTVSNLPYISGTASDNIGLSKVQVRIKSNGPGLFWNPGDYTAGDFKFVRGETDEGAWFDAANTANWSTGPFN
ncbi:MAG: hypothetical protein AAB576_04785, partial [Elusimicrobiota bacterium]